MTTVHGTMTTERPERYAKRLVSHWSEHGPVSEEDGAIVQHLERFGQRDDLHVVWEV